MPPVPSSRGRFGRGLTIRNVRVISACSWAVPSSVFSVLRGPFPALCFPGRVPDERGPQAEPLYHGHPWHASATLLKSLPRGRVARDSLFRVRPSPAGSVAPPAVSESETWPSGASPDGAQCGRRSPSGDRAGSGALPRDPVGGSEGTPHATSWLCGSYRTVGSLGTRSTSRQEPLVLSRGAVGATPGVGPVGLVRPVGPRVCNGSLIAAASGVRAREDPPSPPRPLVLRLWRASLQRAWPGDRFQSPTGFSETLSRLKLAS
jgi:hypothetical protein